MDIIISVAHLCHNSGGERPNSGSIFIGGFVLGGIIVGTLGCVYAPQVVVLVYTTILIIFKIIIV